MQKAQQAFLDHHLGVGSVGQSMASGDDGWLEGFLAHGHLANAARSGSLALRWEEADARL
jgi:hypothetical protein